MTTRVSTEYTDIVLVNLNLTINSKFFLLFLLPGYPYLAGLSNWNADGEAQALCVYLKTINVKHLAVFLHDRRDDFLGLYKDLVHIAPMYDIVVHPFEFGMNPHNETWQLDDAIERLLESGINYILGYLYASFVAGYQTKTRFVLEKLIDKGLVGTQDYFWIFQGSLFYQFDESHPWLFIPMDERLATAINHTVMLTTPGQRDTAMDSQLDESVFELVHDRDFWPYFESIRQMRDMNSTRSIPFSFYSDEFLIWTLWVYDAVVSYGLAACQTGNETMFTGPELYERILNLDFMGASGTVNFDKQTGGRDQTATEYSLTNLVTYNGTAVHEGQNSTFDNTGGDFAAMLIKKHSIQPMNGKVVTHKELLLPYGSTTPPKPTFSPEIIFVDLVPFAANVVCWALAGLVMLLSLGFGAWTLLHLDYTRIRASQPIFLVPLCLGKSSRTIPSRPILTAHTIAH
jgi:hypothetical protein